MASLFTKCCCTGNCFWGWNSLGNLGDDFGFCSHNTTEQLYLRIPRGEFTTSSTKTVPSNIDCGCSGTVQLNNKASGTTDIIVKYQHYPGESGTRLYNWKWYDPFDSTPKCGTSGIELVRNCWGYDSSGTSDDDCCGDPTDTTKCQSVWRNPTDPSSGVETYMAKGQRDICSGVPLDRTVNTTNGGTPIVESEKDFGDGFRWLENIANYETGVGQKRFKKWNYDTTSGWTSSDRILVGTMFVVLHRTKWYKRYFNSIHPDDGGSETGTVASCRTPEYWVYECSGFPIFSWEIKNAPTSVITETQKQQLFLDKAAGDPMNQEVLDALVSHLGCEPKDHGQTNGEVVFRTLTDVNGDTYDHYAYAREAGWKSVCYDKDTVGKFPQWETAEYGNTSCDAAPGCDCCFTAAPIPQSTSCSVFDPNNVNCSWDECGSAPAGCSPLVSDCDFSNTPTGCAIDSAVGDCSGIWFHYNQYCNALVLPPGASNHTGGYECCVHNEAFLCVVPNALSVCDCSTLPFYGPESPIPPAVSSSIRNGVSALNTNCCGGKSTLYETVGDKFCDRCNSNNTQVCSNPEDSEFCE